MGWRFRKSVKILPGVKLNFGKRGFTSATFGKGFFKTNVSKKGVKHTVSIPGTGVSYQTKTQPFQQNQNQVLYKPTETCWTCSKCLMINLPDSGYCEDCGQENPRVRQLRAQQTGQLNWYCKTCYTPNNPENRVCKKCGGDFNPNPQQFAPKPTYNTVPVLLGVVLFLVVGCLGFIFLIGIISAFTPKTNYSQVSSTPTPNKLASTIEKPVETPKPLLNKPVVKSLSSKSATVISENANLRKTADQSGEVIQIIPLGSNIEVLKQKGAWFLVSYGSAKGWMHGNTIRYDETPASTLNTPIVEQPDSTNSYSTPSVPSTDYESGPKTVYVRGYTRRDGTYVAPYMRRSPRR